MQDGGAEVLQPAPVQVIVQLVPLQVEGVLQPEPVQVIVQPEPVQVTQLEPLQPVRWPLP